jgi:hypothetical protein
MNTATGSRLEKYLEILLGDNRLHSVREVSNVSLVIDGWRGEKSKKDDDGSRLSERRMRAA